MSVFNASEQAFSISNALLSFKSYLEFAVNSYPSLLQTAGAFIFMTIKLDQRNPKWWLLQKHYLSFIISWGMMIEMMKSYITRMVNEPCEPTSSSCIQLHHPTNKLHPCQLWMLKNRITLVSLELINSYNWPNVTLTTCVEECWHQYNCRHDKQTKHMYTLLCNGAEHIKKAVKHKLFTPVNNSHIISRIEEILTKCSSSIRNM